MLAFLFLFQAAPTGRPSVPVGFHKSNAGGIDIAGRDAGAPGDALAIYAQAGKMGFPVIVLKQEIMTALLRGRKNYEKRRTPLGGFMHTA
jgi:hypothetical protein